MPKFKVEVKETLLDIICLEADNEDDALDKVRKAYSNEDIILMADNMSGDTEFKIVEEG